MLIMFVVLIIGPIIIGKKVGGLGTLLTGSLSGLSQPTGYSNNDTNCSPTGYALTHGGNAADPSSTVAVKFRRQEMLHW